MTFKFTIAITTALGSCSGDLYANSLQQVKDAIPDEVTIYDVTIGRSCPEKSELGDREVQHDLLMMVDHISEAATITPEKVAAEHAAQLRALSGMTVRLK